MKKSIFLFTLFLVLKGVVSAQCDFAIEPHGGNRCFITIVDPLFLSDSIVACRDNMVDYSAVGDSIGSYSYDWQVVGGTIVSMSSDSTLVTILWGSGDEGLILLTRHRGRRSCTTTCHVSLVDKPTVASSSVPNYTVTVDGEIIVNVCTGDRIVFTDISTSDGTPITDYYWEWEGQFSVAPTYEFTPPEDGTYTIKHRVYNRCGCYDEEEIIVNAADNCPLEVSCYGTACGGSEQTYTLLSPYCDDYVWSVENGTLLSGQGNPRIVVEWGNPQSGYGVITLDGSSCECDCKALKSIRVPIISDGVSIGGPDTVCIGVGQLYSLPLYGSTSYTWTVSPAGATLTATGYPNEYLIRFDQAGTYTVSADYTCPFLGCVGSSQPLTVTVLDSLRMSPRAATICQGASFSCTTDSPLPVSWTVLKGDSVVFDTVGATMTFRFGMPGNYDIQARSGSRCNTARCALTVKGRPATPSALTYPASACPNSTVMLGGHALPGNYLEWRSAYGGTIPNQVEGDTVNISFGDTIATLLVLQVDRETGCRSDSTVIRISEFTLAQLQNDTVKICQGQTVTLSVDDQSADGVLYNWWVQFPDKAAIKGTNRGSVAEVTANYTGQQIPYVTRVYLERSSCAGHTKEYVVLKIGETTPPEISFTPNPICQKENVTFQMDLEHRLAASAWECQWNGGGTTDGLTHHARFTAADSQLVSLHYVSQYGCLPVNTSIRVFVNPVHASYLDTTTTPGMICMEFVDNVGGSIDYEWNTGATTHCIPYVRGESYWCVASVSGSPCQSRAELRAPTNLIPCALTVTVPGGLTSTFNLDNTITFERHPPVPSSVQGINVSYNLNGHSRYYAFTEQTLTISPDTVGPYTASIQWQSNDTCYIAYENGTVTFIPKLSIRYNCADSLIVVDSSSYYDIPFGNRTIQVYKSGNVLLGQRSTSGFNGAWRTSVPLTNVTDGETLNLYLYGSAGFYHTTYLFRSGPHNITINARSNMCNQTPFLFSGNAEGEGLTYKWVFGDDSYNFGQYMWHAYADIPGDKTVTLFVTDSQDCTASTSVEINTQNNPFETHNSTNDDSYKIHHSPAPYPICSGTPLKLIYYSANIAERTPVSYARYVWTPQNDTTFGDSNYATYSGPHFVYATDTVHLCKGAGRTDLRFLNTPKAIIGHQNYYCLGEEIRLQGNTGQQYSYLWTVTSPSYTVTTYNTPNISFDAGETGTWEVKLVVTAPPGMGGCSSDDMCTFDVVDNPDAPTVAFSGNQCITEGPVTLVSVDGDNLSWSNGEYGTLATYYFDGIGSAFYVDPLTGCKSPTTQISIPLAPRFDALLTGCYYMCEENHGYIDVFSLGSSVHYWEWLENNTVVDQGQTLPASLLIEPDNTYTMTAEYGQSCVYTSPELQINGMNCEENIGMHIQLVMEDYELELDGCSIIGKFSFHFVSDYAEDLLFDNFTFSPNQTLLNLSPSTMLVPSNSVSGTVNLDIVFTDLSQPIVYICLMSGTDTLGSFRVNLLEWLEQQELHSGCHFASALTLTYDPDMGTAGQSVFYNFGFHPLSSNAMMVWSDEGEVVRQYHDPFTNYMMGQLFLDYGKLSQLVYADSCVHLHLLVCEDDKLCIADTCIGAGHLMENIREPEFQPQAKGETDGYGPDTDVRYALVPNPSTGLVTVIDAESRRTASDIVEVEVFSINGRREMDVRDNASFNVGSLSVATYIVKVVSKDGKMEFFKLVKY